MELLTVNEAAAILKITRQGVCKQIKNGKIRAARIGKQYRIEKAWLEEYINEQGRRNKTASDHAASR